MSKTSIRFCAVTGKPIKAGDIVMQESFGTFAVKANIQWHTLPYEARKEALKKALDYDLPPEVQTENEPPKTVKPPKSKPEGE